MPTNLPLVRKLSAEGNLRVAMDPGALPPPRAIRPAWDRVEGMLLGLAIGDSLGNTSESRSPMRRRLEVGEVRDYLPNRHAAGKPVGMPSDDTQLAFRTVEHLLESKRLDPDRLADRLADGQIFGLGSTVKGFLQARAQGAKGWLAAAQESAGNGALMRIAPVVLPHLRTPSAALWADAALAGAVTHNDFSSNASCMAFVACLWEALGAEPPVPRGFWLDRFLDVAGKLEGPARRYEQRTPEAGDEKVNLNEFTGVVVRSALAEGLDAMAACDSWYSGAYLLETVPSVLYILERHGNDPEEAIIRAVNDTRDNDTVAAIAGAAVGALHGAKALPARWRQGLVGRLNADDDGRLFELVEQAKERWG